MTSSAPSQSGSSLFAYEEFAPCHQIALHDLPTEQNRVPSNAEKGGNRKRNVGKITILPRADGGKDAWLFLAGCFILEALVWGFPFCFGVFQTFYSTHPPFSEHPKGIAAIGTCSTGVMYLFAPVSLYAYDAWPSIRRIGPSGGLTIVISALLAGSFATRVWHLIVTQGVLYAIGGSFLYAPTMTYLDEWFIQRKGLAFGIMWAGVGTAGLIFPFILTALLNKYGFATTLRIWSLVYLILCAPLICFIKPRVSLPTPRLPRQPISYTFLKGRTHFYFQASNVLESLGFFLPSIYLASYATSLSLPALHGTVLLALLNIFSVFGTIFMGFLCDRYHVNTIILVSTIGSSIAVFLFWGLATSLPLLVVFAASYGFFAGGYSAIWAGMMKEIQKDCMGRDAKIGTLMGVLAAGRGVGAVLSGPLSGVLLGRSLGTRLGYGTELGAVIVFTGISAICGFVCFGESSRRDTCVVDNDNDK